MNCERTLLQKPTLVINDYILFVTDYLAFIAEKLSIIIIMSKKKGNYKKYYDKNFDSSAIPRSTITGKKAECCSQQNNFSKLVSIQILKL